MTMQNLSMYQDRDYTYVTQGWNSLPIRLVIQASCISVGRSRKGRHQSSKLTPQEQRSSKPLIQDQSRGTRSPQKSLRRQAKRPARYLLVTGSMISQQKRWEVFRKEITKNKKYRCQAEPGKWSMMITAALSSPNDSLIFYTNGTIMLLTYVRTKSWSVSLIWMYNV